MLGMGPGGRDPTDWCSGPFPPGVSCPPGQYVHTGTRYTEIQRIEDM